MSHATFFWPWQLFSWPYDAIILWTAWNLTIKITLSCRILFILCEYVIFDSVECCLWPLPRPVSETTFLHQFNATKLTSTFAGWAIMQDKEFPLGSFAIRSPCRQTYLTKKEARKKDMPLLRYAALGLANVVVAPATFWTRWHNIFGMKMQHRQHFGLGQYRICIGCVSDMLHETFYIFFQSGHGIWWGTCMNVSYKINCPTCNLIHTLLGTASKACFSLFLHFLHDQ